MEKFELHNKIIQQLRFHRISGLDEEQCADNILSIVQTDWTEGCSCYEDDKTGETWCCNKCGKPTSTHTPHPTIPSDANHHTCPECSWLCSCSDQPCRCCSDEHKTTTLPSDEEIRKYAIQKGGNIEETWNIAYGAKWMRSICQAKLAEMEKEIESLKDDIDVLKARLLLND